MPPQVIACLRGQRVCAIPKGDPLILNQPGKAEDPPIIGRVPPDRDHLFAIGSGEFFETDDAVTDVHQQGHHAVVSQALRLGLHSLGWYGRVNRPDTLDARPHRPGRK